MINRFRRSGGVTVVEPTVRASPSQSTQPLGIVAEEPDHIIMPPTGITPKPEKVVAVTVPVKVAFAFSLATLALNRASATVPLAILLASRLGIWLVLSAPVVILEASRLGTNVDAKVPVVILAASSEGIKLVAKVPLVTVAALKPVCPLKLNPVAVTAPLTDKAFVDESVVDVALNVLLPLLSSNWVVLLASIA